MHGPITMLGTTLKQLRLLSRSNRNWHNPDSVSRPAFRLSTFAALLMLLCLPLVEHLEAQDTGAFEYSVIGIDYGADISTTMLNDYWIQNPAVTISWRMPFYLGDIDFRAGYLPLRSRQESVPDVNNILTTMGWGLPLALSERLNVSGSVHIGNNFMYRPDYGPYEGPESEFAAGAAVLVRYRFSNRWAVRAGIHHTRVYTYHRIDLTYAGAGLELHLCTPGGLVRFLQ